MRAAYQQVRGNGGAPGIDGMSVEELRRYLKGEWQRIREALLADRYQPQPVKRVEIAKPGGGVRQLGIPTVVDRMIQQALHQIMSREFEPGSRNRVMGSAVAATPTTRCWGRQGVRRDPGATGGAGNLGHQLLRRNRARPRAPRVRTINASSLWSIANWTASSPRSATLSCTS